MIDAGYLNGLSKTLSNWIIETETSATNVKQPLQGFQRNPSKYSWYNGC